MVASLLVIVNSLILGVKALLLIILCHYSDCFYYGVERDLIVVEGLLGVEGRVILTGLDLELVQHFEVSVFFQHLVDFFLVGYFLGELLEQLCLVLHLLWIILKTRDVFFDIIYLDLRGDKVVFFLVEFDVFFHCLSFLGYVNAVRTSN